MISLALKTTKLGNKWCTGK